MKSAMLIGTFRNYRNMLNDLVWNAVEKISRYDLPIKQNDFHFLLILVFAHLITDRVITKKAKISISIPDQ